MNLKEHGYAYRAGIAIGLLERFRAWINKSTAQMTATELHSHLEEKALMLQEYEQLKDIIWPPNEKKKD